MLLFRSEEHRHRWGEAHGIGHGATLSLQTLWALADLWYRDRMSSSWRRRTLEETQQAFASVGLTGDFWHLA